MALIRSTLTNVFTLSIAYLAVFTNNEAAGFIFVAMAYALAVMALPALFLLIGYPYVPRKSQAMYDLELVNRFRKRGRHKHPTVRWFDALSGVAVAAITFPLFTSASIVYFLMLIIRQTEWTQYNRVHVYIEDAVKVSREKHMQRVRDAMAQFENAARRASTTPPHYETQGEHNARTRADERRAGKFLVEPLERRKDDVIVAGEYTEGGRRMTDKERVDSEVHEERRNREMERMNAADTVWRNHLNRNGVKRKDTDYGDDQ